MLKSLVNWKSHCSSRSISFHKTLWLVWLPMVAWPTSTSSVSSTAQKLMFSKAIKSWQLKKSKISSASAMLLTSWSRGTLRRLEDSWCLSVSASSRLTLSLTIFSLTHGQRSKPAGQPDAPVPPSTLQSACLKLSVVQTEALALSTSLEVRWPLVQAKLSLKNSRNVYVHIWTSSRIEIIPFTSSQLYSSTQNVRSGPRQQALY